MKGGNEATNGSEITHSPLGEPKTSDACVLLPTDYCLKTLYFFINYTSLREKFQGDSQFF